MTLTANLDTVKDRVKICKKCPELHFILKTCNSCGCFMPVKILLNNSTCPLNKWGKGN